MVRKYHIYTKEEADERDIIYCHWKDAGSNDWGVSDDGFVFQVIKKKTYTDRNKQVRDFFTLPFGNKWGGKKAELSYQSYINGEMEKRWEEREVGKTRTKNAVNAYVAMMLSNKPIDYAILGDIYRPDQKIPEATARRLFKMEKIKQLVEQKTREVLAEKGITKESVIQMIVDAIEVARHKQDAGNMLKGADNLADYLEMKPAKKTITDTLEIDMSSQIEDQIAQEEKRMLVSRSEETNV